MREGRNSFRVTDTHHTNTIMKHTNSGSAKLFLNSQGDVVVVVLFLSLYDSATSGMAAHQAPLSSTISQS